MGMAQPDRQNAPQQVASNAQFRLGLIGRGIQMSRTPAMHLAEARALGLDYSYELIDTDTIEGPEPRAAELLDQAESAGFAGLNVTYPYKQAVIDHLDELSPDAKKIGAVNTILFRNGRRLGHNTDYWGFSEAARQGLSDARMQTVLLLGAGGAGRAVAFALKSLGVSNLLIADTNIGAANLLAKDTGAQALTDLAEAAARADGIVNATPVGMAKLPGTAIDPALLSPDHWVGDIVYFPLETELLRAAKLRGCRTFEGTGMAVFQAVRAFFLFTGHQPDPERMRATFETFTINQDTQQGG